MTATLFLAAHTIPALADSCTQSAEDAQTQQIRIPSHVSNYTIIGKGRAYFTPRLIAPARAANYS